MAKRTVRTFDDFVDEMDAMLPGDDVDVAITHPMERYWMEVADKHGIFDHLDEDY